MNKNILTPLFFVLLVLTLIYNISNSNRKIDDFFTLHQKIASINALNKNLDIFILNNSRYQNFDYVQSDIQGIETNITFIKESELFNELDNKSLKRLFNSLDESFKIKVTNIYRLISKAAVLNNSFRYMQKIQSNLSNQELVSIYTYIVALNFESSINVERLREQILSYDPKNSAEKGFISHAKIILDYHLSLNKYRKQLMGLKLGDKLTLFEKNFSQYSKTIITDLKDVIWILAMLLFIALLIFLYNNHMITKKQQELNRFKKAVENSDNIVLITDKNQKIKYVNEAFERVTGYSLQEVIGQTPALLKSYQKSEAFYDELKETISAGKKWQGEFINKSKDGSITFERGSITPILNENGEIEEYLAIKLDVTKEKETNDLLMEKEKMLAQQSKMAAMREMLESIAHQWRQPLSTISTAASGVSLHQEMKSLDDKKLSEYMGVIVENTQYLSHTIDNFRNYFNTKSERTAFNLEKSMNKVLDLVGYRLNESKAKIVMNADKVIVEGLENEFIQSMINILNNSIEAFESCENKSNLIFIDILKDDNGVVIRIKDNAGGIEKDVISHIFEPYFTTKHELTGTGMGLYMVHEIIYKHFKGEIKVENTQYVYNEEDCTGTQFFIHLPISLTTLTQKV